MCVFESRVYLMWYLQWQRAGNVRESLCCNVTLVKNESWINKVYQGSLVCVKCVMYYYNQVFFILQGDIEKGLEMKKLVLSGFLASEEIYINQLEALLLVRHTHARNTALHWTLCVNTTAGVKITSHYLKCSDTDRHIHFILGHQLM